jgi:hypothetical protein
LGGQLFYRFEALVLRSVLLVRDASLLVSVVLVVRGKAINVGALRAVPNLSGLAA